MIVLGYISFFSIITNMVTCTGEIKGPMGLGKAVTPKYSH